MRIEHLALFRAFCYYESLRCGSSLASKKKRTNNKWMWISFWLYVYPSNATPHIATGPRNVYARIESARELCQQNVSVVRFFPSCFHGFLLLCCCFCQKYSMCVLYVRWLCLDSHVFTSHKTICHCDVFLSPSNQFVMRFNPKNSFHCTSFVQTSVWSRFVCCMFRYFFKKKIIIFTRVKRTIHANNRKTEKIEKFIWNVCDATIIINNCQCLEAHMKIHL